MEYVDDATWNMWVIEDGIFFMMNMEYVGDAKWNMWVMQDAICG